MKKVILAIPGFAAVSSFATTGGGGGDWTSNLDATAFDGVLSSVAPVALAVVIGVAGIRVAIKLINRGAGK